MKFSVIMPVCLSPYEIDGIKSAANPETKFIRSITSFQQQKFKNAEVIIISDGCDIAKDIYEQLFNNDSSIKFKQIQKQSIFSGLVRQTGIEMAQGEIICYLDHDDFIGINHLYIINDNFDTEKYDWVYFNDYLIKGSEGENLLGDERFVRPELYYIGTSMIAHKRDLNVIWGDGYAHDWRMIKKYLLARPGLQIPTTQYYVCHFHSNDF